MLQSNHIHNEEKMRTDQAKAIHLQDVLAALGCQPAKEAQGELWYLSPFRKEAEASFKITRDGKAFFDYGVGKGGNILDFVMHYYHLSLNDVSGALRKLDNLNIVRTIKVGDPDVQPSLWDWNTPQMALEDRRAATTHPSAVQKPKHTDDGFTVRRVQELQNQALVQYLEKRAISAEVAMPWIEEIYYKRNDKSYFALAFANDSGGYELRNPYFKGAQGTKDITLLRSEGQGSKRVMLFEGFMDFLSYMEHTVTKKLEASVLVLNSVAMRERAVEAIERMGAEEVHLYLDRDASGRVLATGITEALDSMTIQDKSSLYDGYKDFNEWLVAKGEASKLAA